MINAQPPQVPSGFDAFGLWLNETINLWKAQWQTWTLMMLILVAISFGAGVISMFLPMISPLIGILIGALFLPGLIIAALKQIRGQEISVADMFSGTGHFGGAFVILLVISAGAIACGIGALFTAGLFFLAIPILIDRNKSIGEALSESWALTTKNVLFFVIFAFVMNLLSGLGVIACGIGLLATAPWYIISMAVAYEHTCNPGA